jgi:hypothetical protein
MEAHIKLIRESKTVQIDFSRAPLLRTRERHPSASGCAAAVARRSRHQMLVEGVTAYGRPVRQAMLVTPVLWLREEKARA